MESIAFSLKSSTNSKRTLIVHLCNCQRQKSCQLLHRQRRAWKSRPESRRWDSPWSQIRRQYMIGFRNSLIFLVFATRYCKLRPNSQESIDERELRTYWATIFDIFDCIYQWKWEHWELRVIMGVGFISYSNFSYLLYLPCVWHCYQLSYASCKLSLWKETEALPQLPTLFWAWFKIECIKRLVFGQCWTRLRPCPVSTNR